MPQPKHGQDLTTGSIPRHLVAFSLPMLLGSFLQTAYSFINAIWVGKFLGTHALAAVTVSFPVVFALIAIGAGLTLATNIQISQHFGAKRFEALRRVVDSSFVLVIGLSLILCALGEWLAPHILRAMDTPPDVFGIAVSYLRIFLLTIPLAFGLFLSRSMLQGIGDSKTTLYFQAFSVVLTTILDPLLMFGWLGFPKLGLNGTAWATLISHFFAVGGVYYYLHMKRSPVSPAWGQLHWSPQAAWTTVRIGFPSAIQQSLVSVGMVFVTGIVNSFGESATAAFGVASRIDQIAFMPAMTFSMAISTLSGQNIGASRLDRVKEIYLWGCAVSGGLTLFISAFVVTLPHFLIQIFTSEPEIVRIGTEYLQIAGSCYVFFALMFVSNGVINGSGHTLVSTLVTLLSLWVVRVPLAWTLSRWWGSVTGVWVAIAAGFGVAMLTSGAYYFSGRWKKPVLRHARAPRPVPSPVELFGEETGEA